MLWARNFMGMQEFTKAQESFDRYLDLAPDGEFIADVEDFLDVLHMQDVLDAERDGGWNRGF